MFKRTSLIALLFISFAGFGQEITATVKVPSSVNPGNDLAVEITVNKAGVNGFMKYFQELPVDYSCNDVDSKGGSFTFADNGAKIIWISPPTTDQFTFNYKITVPASAKGTISVGGKLSYVVGNERKSVEVPPTVVTVGAGAVVASAKTTPVETKKEEPVKTTPVAETKKEEPVKTTPVAETKKEEPVKSTPVETKKEEPVKTTPVAETKKEEPVKSTPVETKKEPVKTAPVTAVATSAGKTYRVQIGAFNLKPKLSGVPQMTTVILDNGMTKCFSGNFSSYEDAKKRKEEMISKGFQGAFIVSFEGGKIVK